MVFLFFISPDLTLKLRFLSVIGAILDAHVRPERKGSHGEETCQYAPVPLRRGMTLQRTLSSFGEAEDPTKYSSDLLFSRMGQAKSAFVRAVLCEFVGRIRTTAGQVGSARDVQDEVLVFAALAHSGVDEVPLGVGVVGLVVAATKVNRLRCLEVDACWHILDLHLRSIGFLALLEIQLELGIAVADNVVGVGADEVRHLGGLERGRV